MRLTPGAHVGPYEILGLIGAGGMGEVYRARDPRLHRAVAVKVLPASYSSDHERLQRFEQEARSAASISHPNIVAVYDVGRDAAPAAGDATPYVVTELLDGKTLHDRLRQAPIPIGKAIDITVQILRGLGAAHAKGIVHRDLKPANIFITSDGQVKILDFGLAKLTHSEPTQGGETATVLATRAGAILGTVGYMSPEQVCGDAVDGRSDLFAVGAILYEMLAGRAPFVGETDAGTLAQILSEDAPELPATEPAIPESLARIVRRCLAKAPAARFQSASDLAFALEGVPASSASTVGIHAPGRRVERARWPRLAAGLALAAVAFGAAALLYVRAPADTPAYHATIVPPANVGDFGSAPPLALSPDGRHLAFAATDANGNRRIWLRRLDQPSAEPLNGTDEAMGPFWSPDGRYIAFIADNALKKIAIVGGPPVTLAELSMTVSSSRYTGSWSEEDQILFQGGRDGSLHRVDANGGTPVPVTSTNSNVEEQHTYPFFLPEGRRFLYLAQSQGEAPALYVGALDGQPSALLLEEVANAQYARGTLMFVRGSTLMAQRFDPVSAKLSGDALPIADQIRLSSQSFTSSTLRAGAFSASESGTLVYLKSSAAASQLVWIDRSGNTVGVLGDPAAYGDVFVSRDGQRATVSIDTAGTGTRDIWTFDLQSGLRRRLTFDPGNEFDGIWAPDGRRMAFNSSRNGVMDIYEKDMTSGDERPLLEGGPSKFPNSWLPDGSALLYTAATQSGQEAWVLPMNGDRAAYRFARGGIGLRFSPDGRWVSYTSSDSGRAEISIKRFPDTGERWNVSTAGGRLATWRQDGRELYYVEDVSNRLMAVELSYGADRIEIGAAQPIATLRPAGPRSFYDAMPDGQRFLVNSVLEQAVDVPITLVVNWPALLDSSRAP